VSSAKIITSASSKKRLLFLSIIEALPFKISDNIVIPILGAIFLFPFHIINRTGSLPFKLKFSFEEISGILLIILLGTIAYLLNWLNLNSAIFSIILGIFITIFGGINSVILMIIFFLLAIFATKFKFSYKLKQKIAESDTGMRGMASVISKGIPPLYTSFFIYIAPKPKIFILSFITLITTATFDTVSSEIGKALSKNAFSLLKLKKVKSGEKGGISLIGTLGGILSSILILYISSIFFNLTLGEIFLVFFISLASNLIEPFFYKIIYNTPITKPLTNFLLLTFAFILSLFFFYFLT